MKKLSGLIPLFSILIFTQTGFCGQPDEKWKDMSYGIDEVDLQSVVISPQNQNMIYAASAKAVYKSSDTGKTWQKLSMIRGTEASITVISVDPKNINTIYAGTRNGLYKSADGGSEWKIIFEGLYTQEKDIKHMVIDQADANRIFLGTGKGVVITRNAGMSWSRLTGEIAKQSINFIAQDPANPKIIYVAAAMGVYKSYNSGLSFERIFTVAAQTQEDETDEDSEDSGEETQTYSSKTTNCVAIDAKDTGKVYVGTNSGVFASSDSGETWEQLPGAGMLNNYVLYLVATKDGSLCAATRNGIFRIFSPYQSWYEIYDGILSKDARYLAYNQNKDSLWAATGKGIYQTHLKPAPEPKDDLVVPDDVAQFLAKFESEPDIREVQEVAIKYADVSIEKINKWQRSSKRKALFPKLSVSVNPYLTDYYHWETGSTSTTSDDILRKGKKIEDWSFSASWELSDLIWSTDQTSIDNRSRLLVQLRDDVLTGVTRLYYERRRLQIELLTKPPENLNLKVAKHLRIEELTAGIDAYTGGWFSKKLKESKSPKGRKHK